MILDKSIIRDFLIIEQINKSEGLKGSGLAMTHFFNDKQALMENVSLQDLTPG